MYRCNVEGIGVGRKRKLQEVLKYRGCTVHSYNTCDAFYYEKFFTLMILDTRNRVDDEGQIWKQ